MFLLDIAKKTIGVVSGGSKGKPDIPDKPGEKPGCRDIGEGA